MKNYPATFGILIVCLAIELLSQFFPGIRDALMFSPELGVHGWLGLVTYQLAHGNWPHFSGNFCFGLPFMLFLESKLGRDKLIEFYFLCGIGSALLNLLLTGPVPLLGASGSLFGVAIGACMAFGETLDEHLLALGLLCALLIPQIMMGPLGPIVGVAFWGHVGGGLTALLLSHKTHSADPRVGF